MVLVTHLGGAGPVGRYRVHATEHLGAFLREVRCRLLISTYDSGLLLTVTGRDDGSIAVAHLGTGRSAGVGISGDQGAVALRTRVLRFTIGDGDEPIVLLGSIPTGAADAHDLALDAGGRVVLVETARNRVTWHRDSAGPERVWRPAFAPPDHAGDTCHLSGVGMVDGRPGAATAFAPTAEPLGWRERLDEGVLVSMATGDVLAAGLWLPHSPRRIGDRWWLCEAGSGTAGFVDGGRYTPVAALPGFARGLAAIGSLVVAGHTTPRPRGVSLGLPLHDRLRKEASPPFAGLAFFEPATGAVHHRLRVDLATGEVFAVAVIPG